MKVLFFFFTMLNIVFFVWQIDIFGLESNKEKVSKLTQNTNTEKLLLLNEMPNKNANRSSAIKKPKKTAPAKTRNNITGKQPSTERLSGTKNQICYALGPFEGLAQAKPISAKLRDLGVSTNERLITREIPTGYWVYLPQFKSWKLAKDKVLALENQNIKDMFIMGRGAMKNAVSLGLFKNQSGAQVRVDQVKKLGENPKIQAQYMEDEKYWIDISVETGQKQAIKTIETIAQTLTILELNPRKCN
ncbi:MAG: hypothetical protein GXP08_12355 [Gammaproteobacteria bacterium]|nr:hypothetical protein [Gammaproteobacteria bacterium]